MHEPRTPSSLEEHSAEHRNDTDLVDTHHEPFFHDRAFEAPFRRTGDHDRLGWLSLVAHDVRCALAGLAMSADILADDVDILEPREIRELAATVRRQAILLQSVTENLLCLDSIAHGRFSMQPQAIQLTDVLRDARDSLGILLDRRRQRLLVRTRGDLPPVWADRRRMAQVLINLLSNANKFSGPGTICVTLTRHDDTVRVSVTDRGPGISPEDRERIFQHFYRGAMARSNETEGSGLGLAIVKAIVEAHGGRVSAENRRGGGARCWFELPIAVAPSLGAPDDARRAAAPAAARQHAEPRPTAPPALAAGRAPHAGVGPRLKAGSTASIGPARRPHPARAS